MHHTDKNSEHCSIIWPQVFVYERSGSGFESSCSHLRNVRLAKQQGKNNVTEQLPTKFF